MKDVTVHKNTTNILVDFLVNKHLPKERKRSSDLSVRLALDTQSSVASRLAVPIRVVFLCRQEGFLAAVLLASFGFS